MRILGLKQRRLIGFGLLITCAFILFNSYIYTNTSSSSFDIESATTVTSTSSESTSFLSFFDRHDGPIITNPFISTGTGNDAGESEAKFKSYMSIHSGDYVVPPLEVKRKWEWHRRRKSQSLERILVENSKRVLSPSSSWAPTLDSQDSSDGIDTSNKQHRVAVVSMYHSGASELVASTKDNKMQYAKRNGYVFIDAGEDAVLKAEMEKARGKESGFDMALKFFVLARVLDGKFTDAMDGPNKGKVDWVLWSDADAMFLNHSKSLELAGVADDDFDLVLPGGHPQDWHWGQILNAGHFAVRNSPWGRYYVDMAWRTAIKANDHSLIGGCPANPYGNINGWLNVCSGGGYWLGDQGIAHAVTRQSHLPTNASCHIKWVNMRDMNSEAPWFRNGDLVVHLPGRGNKERAEFFGIVKRITTWETGELWDEYAKTLWAEKLDWRVGRGLFADTKASSWNVACRELFHD